MAAMQKIGPVWAEINLDKLEHNIHEVTRVVKKETLICAVVKADGYGHGAPEIAKTLLKNGADRLAVATVPEALRLRRFGIKVPIIVLGYTDESWGEDILDKNIIQTVLSYQQAQYFSQLARDQGKKMTIHIKIDTGMSRLGLQVNDDTIEKIKKMFILPNIIIEGIYTHFAVADESDKTFTYEQFNKFMSLVNALERDGYHIPIKHVSNSAAIIDLPEMNLDMVRAGIILYGLYPSLEVNKEAMNLKQVMELKTRVSHIKTLPPGRGISYGLKYKTDGERQIITLPVGYADGFTRMLTGKAEVLVRGKTLPIVGKICMDQCMADATGMNIDLGEEVTLYSSDPGSNNTIDRVAAKLGTINYEIICMVGKRVPRVYIRDREYIHVKEY